MRYVESSDEGRYVDTEVTDLDMEPVQIVNADGFGATDVIVGGHCLTWAELDILKAGIQLAEEKWR